MTKQERRFIRKVIRDMGAQCYPAIYYYSKSNSLRCRPTWGDVSELIEHVNGTYRSHEECTLTGEELSSQFRSLYKTTKPIIKEIAIDLCKTQGTKSTIGKKQITAIINKYL